jgi:hypothetical protein
MRFWIVVMCSAVVLAAAIWPFGAKPGPQPTFPPVAISPQPSPEPAKPEPPKVIETIDLSRAYDPAREDEPISPATFLEIVPEPERIDVMPREVISLDLNLGGHRSGQAPNRAERIDVMPREVVAPPRTSLPTDDSDPNVRADQLLNESEDLRQAREEFHRFWMNNQPSMPTPERLDVMPREVIPLGNGLLDYVPAPEHFNFFPMGVPYATGVVQEIPPNASIQNGLLNFTPTCAAPAERLDVMPREVTIQNGLMDFVPEWRRLWMNNQPSVFAQDRHRGIGPDERLDVMPREVPDDPRWDTLEGIRQSYWPLGASQPTGIRGGLLSFVPSHEAATVRVQPPMGLDIGTFELIPQSASSPERLDVLPHEVLDDPFKDVLDQVRNAGGTFFFQCRPESAEPLTVVPRVLPARFVIEQPDGRLLHYMETGNEAVVRVSGFSSPADERLTHPIPRGAFKVPLIPVERLTVEPRVHVGPRE